MMAGKPELINNEAQSQFEIHVDGQVAFIEYAIEDRKIYLTHTEVPESLQGNGIGSALVRLVLQYIKKNHLVLFPLCSFVAHYVDNHTEWHSILSEGYQM
ncbi:MAG TPA: GNAT family N-acetyltransferase [Flavobacterium sp.]|nr:GNAT family N-acetyltransferase [Flavobacterium sp.]